MSEGQRAPLPHAFHPPVAEFAVTSDDVTPGGVLKDAQVYAEGNVSPQLRWDGFPAETKSFAVTCFDPDAPTGSSVTDAGSGGFAGLPAGATHARNDYGSRDFGGAAPPAGDPAHRYVFTVYAVDTEKLGPDADTSPAAVGFNLRFHTLGRAQLVGEYAAPAAG